MEAEEQTSPLIALTSDVVLFLGLPASRVLLEIPNQSRADLSR